MPFTIRTGETVDAGTIRMETVAPDADFRVVDEKGTPVAGIAFELVAADGDALDVWPGLSQFAERSGPSLPDVVAGTAPNLHFRAVQRARYVLRCRDTAFDAAPRVVEPTELRSAGTNGPIATIVVRPANAASFVLDPPIAKGTLVVVESTGGLPVRELDVDDFGIATTELLPGDYRLHLVEYGRATGAIDVRVDSNPFVFEIHR